MARKIFAGHDAALKSELKMTGQLLDSGLNIFRLFRRHWTGMTAIKDEKAPGLLTPSPTAQR